ncbi:hypothetical protein MMC34_001842 [Xylographa carneopallida]|nr:hypothetical protein [Xylographa carneopallida]
MRLRQSPALLVTLSLALLPQTANCIMALCLQSDNEPLASECQLAVQQILVNTPLSHASRLETWIPIPDGLDDDPRFDDMLACGAQWIHGSCAVTMGCDRAARASLLQIHDTAAQAVASCVGPRGQSPARSFNSLAFYDDRTRAEWWVTVGRPDDFLYYHVDVEQSLEVFMVRMEVAIASLLVWYQIRQRDLG